MIRTNVLLSGLLAVFSALVTSLAAGQDAMEIAPSNTVRLTIEGDLASQMVDGIDRFLLKQIEESAASRVARFTVDTSSAEAYRPFGSQAAQRDIWQNAANGFDVANA